jgi:hypothetical protein
MFSCVTYNITFFVREDPFYVEHETRAILEEVSAEALMNRNSYSVVKIMA